MIVRDQPLAVGTGSGDEVFDACLTPVRGPNGSVIGAHMVGFEVGARQRAEATLRESEERFRAFVTASADVVYRPWLHVAWTERGVTMPPEGAAPKELAKAAP